MRRRPRPFKRFVPRLETLEHRHMLSTFSEISSIDGIKLEADVLEYKADAVATSNGQPEVLAVAHGDLASRDVLLDIYNYHPPGPGASVGSFNETQALQTDIPAGRDVKLAFGDLNSDGLPDLVVAGSDGHGSVIVQLFTSTQVSGGGGITTHPIETFTLTFGATIDLPSWRFVPSHDSVALGDLNGDGAPDVVLTTPTQVGVLLGTPEYNSSGVLSGANNYQPLPAVASPFLPYLPLPGGKNEAGVQDSKNIADGAARSVAVEGIMRNDQGGYDLVTEAEGRFLFAQIVISTSQTTTPPASTVTFPPVPQPAGATPTSVESIAINPGGTSSLQPLTAPLTGHAQPASEIFATSIICITYPCPGDWTPPSLAAVIGDKLYVGTAISTTAGGATHEFGGAIGWTSETITAVGHPAPFNGGLPIYFLADLDSDGDLDLYTVVIIPGSECCPGYVLYVLAFPDALGESSIL